MSTIADRLTARLRLSRCRPEHFASLHTLHSNPDVMATLGGVRSTDETQRVLDALVAHWEEHGFGYWIAHERASGRFAGRGGLRCVELDGHAEVEVGYGLMPEFWGQGLATELARESVRVGFDELGVAELIAFTLPTNRASRRVMEKAGFRYVGDTVWADRPHVLYRQSRRRDSLSG